MKEWKYIDGLDNKYRVSNEGDIYSELSERVLSTYIINSGYEVVKITYNGNRYTHQVHRLVATYFCEGYREGFVVNHKDGDKRNNNHSNLEWMSQRDNVRDQISRGTLNVASAHKVAWEKNKKPIILIHPDGTEEEFGSIKEGALKYELLPSKIADVAKGKRKHHKGFKARYTEDGQ